MAAAYGDNLHAPAHAAAQAIGLSEADEALLREFGELVNYNAYGETEAENVRLPPAALFARCRRLCRPRANCIAAEPALLARLRACFESDMAHAHALAPTTLHEAPCGVAAMSLPDAPWARRVNGVFANELARARPERAHAVLVAGVKEGAPGYMVSVRAPSVRGPTARTRCAGNFHVMQAAAAAPPASTGCLHDDLPRLGQILAAAYLRKASGCGRECRCGAATGAAKIHEPCAQFSAIRCYPDAYGALLPGSCHIHFLRFRLFKRAIPRFPPEAAAAPGLPKPCWTVVGAWFKGESNGEPAVSNSQPAHLEARPSTPAPRSRAARWSSRTRALGLIGQYQAMDGATRLEALRAFATELKPDAQPLEQAYAELHRLPQHARRMGDVETRLREAMVSPRARVIRQIGSRQAGVRFLVDVRARCSTT